MDSDYAKCVLQSDIRCCGLQTSDVCYLRALDSSNSSKNRRRVFLVRILGSAAEKERRAKGKRDAAAAQEKIRKRYFKHIANTHGYDGISRCAREECNASVRLVSDSAIACFSSFRKDEDAPAAVKNCMVCGARFLVVFKS